MRVFCGLVLLAAAGVAGAQDLAVYDDALRNGFLGNYSYGGGTNLANNTPTHDASALSIAFTGGSNNSNAVAFPNETTDFSTTQFVGIRFFVHGGVPGGQQLRLQVYNNLGGAPLANVELEGFVSGGAIAAGQWRQVDVPFAQLGFAGTFDRFDVQADGPVAQQTLYLDDVELLGAAVFADGFENVGAAAAGQLRFGAATYAAGETDGAATITVQRVGGSSGAVSVSFATSNGTATAPGDYAATSGMLAWADGDATTKSFNVPIVADAVPEADETVALALSNPVGTTLAAPSAATLTIGEPEMLFVPQYGTARIRVYRRDGDTFVLANIAALPAGSQPNAVAFAPDGKLWVVDTGATNRLLRYATADVATLPNPVAEVVIGPIANNTGDLFDLAFFGDFAYVSQGFGADRILKYPQASLAATGNPAPALLTNANLATPAGLEFDAQGRLWISNFGNSTIVRMNTSTAAVDKVATSVAIGARGSLSAPEGLAFDAEGSLWVGNNGKPTISAYASWQLDDAGFGATTPVHQIDIDPGVETVDFMPHTGFVGGVAFDRDGDLWANYEYTYSVREYGLASGPRAGGLPGVGSYVSTPGQTLADATTDPGFGGLAFWPVPASLNRSAKNFRGTNLVGMEFNYAFFAQATGPVPGQNYVVHDTRVIDYYAAKGITTLRFLFSWEGMQSALMGPIPASNAGNYKQYFDDYKRIVDYATTTKGMRVIITPWQANPGGGAGGPRWRGGLVGDTVPTAAWSDFWTKFAAVYAANPRVAFGLVNEPNQMSTMGWWAIAQAGVTAIRAAGATQTIYVPGNGYTAASTWTSGNYFNDPDAVKRSNAYGWLNANGVGQPIADPLDDLVAEVHTYVDADQGGSTTGITSVTAAREHLAGVIAEGRLRGYSVYLGELGFLATEPLAPAAWNDFVAYFEANPDVFVGYTWFAGGDPLFWQDVGANGGGHFAISPNCAAVSGGCPAVTPGCARVTDTCPALYTGDTVNMDLIEADFQL